MILVQIRSDLSDIIGDVASVVVFSFPVASVPETVVVTDNNERIDRKKSLITRGRYTANTVEEVAKVQVSAMFQGSFRIVTV
jgi:hypothetical protein